VTLLEIDKEGFVCEDVKDNGETTLIVSKDFTEIHIK